MLELGALVGDGVTELDLLLASKKVEVVVAVIEQIGEVSCIGEKEGAVTCEWVPSSGLSLGRRSRSLLCSLFYARGSLARRVDRRH